MGPFVAHIDLLLIDKQKMSVIVAFLLALGTLKLLSAFISLLGALERHYMRGKMDHLARYGGKGTWALVTGATDGIGLEFCK